LLAKPKKLPLGRLKRSWKDSALKKFVVRRKEGGSWFENISEVVFGIISIEP